MGQVIDPNSLLVKTDQQAATATFFNILISAFCNAINGIGVRMDGYDVAEQNLVNLGLANINAVLGPFLSTLQEAAQLGFLVAEADGANISLSLNQPFGMVLTSVGAELFTPTKWLMVMDVNDSTNWGVLELLSWVPQDLNLATTCIYATKTQASTSWQVCCGSGILNAMVNDLVAANSAASAAQTANTNAQSAMTYVQSVATSISAGPVVSVAGKTGAVTLLESDVANLSADLANRPTIASVNTSVSGLQPHSATLDQLTALTLSSFIIAWLGAANATAAMTTLGAAPLASPTFTGAPAAPTATAGDNSTKLATTAFTAAAIAAAAINSTQIAAVFNDQIGTSYTFSSTDYGKPVTLTNAAAITVTLPNNLPKGWNTIVYQGGVGQVTFSAASGATLVNHGGHSKTGGQYAMATLMVMSNSGGSNAVIALGGDVA